MMTHPVTTCFSLLAVAMATSLAAHAERPPTIRPYNQPIEQRGYEAVDQMVEDVDPFARSLRQVEPGLGYEGGQSGSIYRRRDAPENGPLFYVSPGVVAEFDRSQYTFFIDRHDNVHPFHAVPPGTVFHLGLPRVDPPQTQRPRQPSPLRVRSQVDGRAMAAGAGAAVSSVNDDEAAARERRQADRGDERALRYLLQSQRRGVIDAIGRRLD